MIRFLRVTGSFCQWLRSKAAETTQLDHLLSMEQLHTAVLTPMPSLPEGSEERGGRSVRRARSLLTVPSCMARTLGCISFIPADNTFVANEAELTVPARPVETCSCAVEAARAAAWVATASRGEEPGSKHSCRVSRSVTMHRLPGSCIVGSRCNCWPAP